MDYEMNENMFVSQLRQPSRIPSPDKLTELSASANNARPASMLPPPPGTLKRKTLAERAGEVSRPAPNAPGSKYSSSTLKGTSMSRAARPNDFSASTYGRPPATMSNHSRSNSTFASSTNSMRAPSAQSTRPHTSMSNHIPMKPLVPTNRPGTSFDNRLNRSSRLDEQNGTRTSMLQFPSSSIESPTRARKNISCSTSTAGSEQTEHTSVTFASSPEEVPAGITYRVKSLRDISISTALCGLSLDEKQNESVDGVPRAPPTTPSQLPKKKSVVFNPPSRPSSPMKSPSKTPKRVFLSKSSNVVVPGWDPESRLENVEKLYEDLRESMKTSTSETTGLRETISLYKARILELETSRVQLNANNASLQKEIDTVKAAMTTSSLALEEVKRRHDVDIDDLRRKYRNDFDQAIREAEEEARRRDRQYADDLREIKRKAENDLEDEQNARRREVHALSSEIAKTQQGAELQVESKQKALRDLADELATAKAETERVRQDGLEAEDRLRAEIEREKLVQQDLKTKLSEAAATTLNLESSLRSAQARVAFLESDCKSQSQAFADLEQKTQDAVRAMEVAQEKLRVEETLRRKLHNQVQELKGNIRVFCRVRPPLFSEPEEDHARITFPDEQDDAKEVEITGPEEKSSLGKITTKKHPFSFDRVFGTGSQNKEIFDEISQLVQSALDGYNVCIFCYGQTGAGKTYTMSSEDGMIPRAVNQIYDTAKSLEEKGWAYTMEGSFVEVYNENINDLLGKADDFDKKKHEIRHDMQKMKTTITDITTVALDSPNKVESILKRAMNNRSVAATKANERSSRSHSVFILTLNGTNSITGETSSGTLNLVDLAGSERLSQSGATGERLKETQNINKSLSCLGDVIGALGQQGKGGEVGHIPYRNSKLTYLLQFSLGGNSKTLMFVMISPLGRHLGETLTSLKFATKVHNTHIGTAKRVSK